MTSLPFPWVDTDGMANVLRDPAIWPIVFDEPDSRRSFKGAGKQVLGATYHKLGWGKSVADERSFGQLAATLLASRRGRARLETEFRKAFNDTALWTTVAQRLYSRVVLGGKSWDEVTTVPHPSDVCQEKRGKWYIEPDRFADWLSEHKREGLEFRKIALFACSFAILQPRDGERLSRVLLEYDQEFAKLVLDDVSRMDELTSERDARLSDTQMKQPDFPASRSEELEARVAALRKACGELASRLRDAADEVERDGAPVDNSLRDAVDRYAASYSLLCDDLHRHAADAGCTRNEEASEQRGFVLLASLLADIGRAMQRDHEVRTVRDRVADLLAAVDRIRAEPDAPSLEPIQKSAQALRARLNEASVLDDPELRAVVSGQHPLECLVAFTRELRKLDNARWQELREDVEQAFGKEIATGIVRGLIRVSTTGPDSEQGKPSPEPRLANQQVLAVKDRARVQETAERPSDREPITTTDAPATAEPGLAGSVAVDTSAKTVDVPPSQLRRDETTDVVGAPAVAQQKRRASMKQHGALVEPPATAPDRAGSPTSESAARCPETAPAAEPRRASRGQEGGPADLHHAAHAASATLSQLATGAERSSEPERALSLLHLSLGFVRDGRLPYALHLAEHIEAVSARSGALATELRVPSAAYRVLAIGPHVGSVFGDHSTTFTDALTELYDIVSGAKPCMIGSEELHMLIFAAALQPALIGPTADAVNMLQTLSLPAELSELSALRDTVVEFSRFGSRVSARLLKGLVEHDLWKNQLEDLRSQTIDWLSHSKQCTIIYAPTTDVWQSWLADNGPLGMMLASVIHDRRSNVNDVAATARHWSEIETINDELKRTDRQLRGRKADLRPIEARAKSAVRKKVAEAIGFAQRWVTLQGQEPEQLENFTLAAIAKCRRDVQQHLGALRKLVGDLVARPATTIARAAALAALSRAFSALEHLFDPDALEVEDRSVAEILNSDLLRFPDLELADDWAPLNPAHESTAAAIISAAKQEPSWTEALSSHCVGENFKAAEAILDLSRRGIITVDKAEELQRGLEERRRETRLALRLCKDETEKSAQRAVFDGALGHGEFQTIVARLEALAPDSLEDLRPVRRELEAIRTDLETARRDHISEVEDQLSRRGVRERFPDVFKRVRAVLEAGDVRTAQEFLALHEQGQALPDETPEPAFQFFPRFVDDADAVFQGRQAIVPETIRAIREQKPLGALTFSAMPPAQARDAADMIEAWLQLCNKTSSLQAKVADVLRALGFEGVALKQTTDRLRENHIWFDLTVRTLDDRSICPIPQFASDTHGFYNLLLMWGRPLEGDIVSKAAPGNSHAPILVFYFGQMSTRRRRDLAHRCRRDKRPVLVVDDYLLLFAACEGERRKRLAALLQGAMHFTVGEPFTTTAGYVPPEMFYGRAQELDRLAAPNNCHLVYGGRQLGKTALLRQLERARHSPEHGRIVRWVDLTNQWGIGLNRPIADLWVVISRVLGEHGIVPNNVSAPETIERHILEWLNQDRTRQIVLLLDEADLFLESDSRGEGGDASGKGAWLHTRKLKALCENSQRRFKFVLAGLHNVQRSSRDPNSPIAHLGTAICVGPFLSGPEIDEARHMIRRPLEAIGYRFASPDLVMRILAYTNYYPSLIQLFCRHLLEYLTSERTHFDRATTPLYEITAKHIEDAYQSRAMHNSIVERFNWTLRLDQRYRAIALLLAHSVLTDGSRQLAEGVTLSRIREEAISLWPKGFASDSSIDAFQTLVDEMIGLGVLREVGRGRYSFRSPNVLKMLGTDEQILDALLQVTDEEPRIQFQAATFRRGDVATPWRRSPLTAQQEATLRSFESQSRLSLIYGSRLSGLDDVPGFLRMLEKETSELSLHVISSIGRIGDFASALDSRLGQLDEGVTILVVSPECPWDSTWIAHACDRLGRRRGARKFVNLVFLADPARAWEYLGRTGSAEDAQRSRVTVTELSLKPWSDEALRRLLDVIGVVDDAARRRRISELTGNWHYPLQEMASFVYREPHKLGALLDELETGLKDVAKQAQLLGLLEDTRRVLSTAAQLSPDAVGPDDLAMLVPELGEPARVRRVLLWADRLQYVQLAGPDKWALNPFVARLVSA